MRFLVDNNLLTRSQSGFRGLHSTVTGLLEATNCWGVCVIQFYVKAMGYALSNLPMNDEVLTNAKFVNVMSRDEASLAQVEYFVGRFSNLLPYSSPLEHDKLGEQLIEYQLLDDSEIPESVWKSATIQEDKSVTYYGMDVIWHYLANPKTVDGSYRFGRISKVAKLVLIIPDSNAEEERIFSMVRKNQTSFRPNHDPNGTLSSILTIKLANDKPAHAFQPPNTMVKKAKSATWDYNKLHSSVTSTKWFWTVPKH